MDELDFNSILERQACVDKMKKALTDFQNNKKDLLQKRGIYIYGAPGSGKTKFAISVLEELGYDIIKYDAGEVRNKSVIENITKRTMSDRNILNMFKRENKPIAILMDEIDGMNNGDKGGINSLIKLIRPKKTKKQKLEDSTANPIICVSNYHIDKKIKELMKVCVSIEIKTPTNKQVNQLVKKSMPLLDKDTVENLIKYLQGDLRKFSAINKIYCNHNSLLKNKIIKEIFKPN